MQKVFQSCYLFIGASVQPGSGLFGKPSKNNFNVLLSEGTFAYLRGIEPKANSKNLFKSTNYDVIDPVNMLKHHPVILCENFFTRKENVPLKKEHGL